MIGSVGWELKSPTIWPSIWAKIWRGCHANSDRQERAVLVSAGDRVPCLVIPGSRIECIAGIAFDPTCRVAPRR